MQDTEQRVQVIGAMQDPEQRVQVIGARDDAAAQPAETADASVPELPVVYEDEPAAPARNRERRRPDGAQPERLSPSGRSAGP